MTPGPTRTTAVVLALLLASTGAGAASLFAFDFENFALGQISGAASDSVPEITATWNMFNNGVEMLAGSTKSSMTRWFGILGGQQVAPSKDAWLAMQ